MSKRLEKIESMIKPPEKLPEVFTFIQEQDNKNLYRCGNQLFDPAGIEEFERGLPETLLPQVIIIKSKDVK